MKKHPIDDLFKRKLSDGEKQPSSAAWARIQKEQKNTERRFAGWIWYAAASITVILMTGYFIWQNQHENLPEIASGKTIAVVEKKDSNKLIIAKDLVKHTDSVKNIEVQIAKVNENKIKLKRVEPVEVNSTNQVISKLDLQNKTEIKNPDIERIANKSFESKPADSKLIASPIPLDIEKEITPKTMLAIVEEKQENHTIVVKVDEPETDPNEKPKSSKFIKLFRQLKNARAGDPVDWKDVGFNPKTVVAKVDEKIHEKEEIISEKYQNIKERTKL